MKKMLFTGALLLLTVLGLRAQSYVIRTEGEIPKEAEEVLVQRFTQMLEVGGLAVSEAGTPLTVGFEVKDRMETPGSMSQVALQLEIKAVAGEVEEVFPVKGVGENEADAWLRAVKQLLPRSKAARSFVEKLK